jgi:DNA-binding transcriptional MocR family regulator
MTQREINTYLEMYDLDERIEMLKVVYKKRRDLMVEEMKKNFPPEVKIFVPQGGLFVWLEFPEDVNTVELFKKALEKNVAFVPGDPFYPNEGGQNTCRLSFSSMTEDKIVEGIGRLAAAIKEM